MEGKIDDAAVMQKMRKVMAMLEGATTEGEAKAAADALQRLQAAHGICAARAREAEVGGGVGVCDASSHAGQTIPLWKAKMADAVAKSFRCGIFWASVPGRKNSIGAFRRDKYAVFVGEGNDAEVARDAYDAACRAAEGCWAAYREGRKKDGRPVKGPSERTAYLICFAEALGEAWDAARAGNEALALALAVPESVRRDLAARGVVDTVSPGGVVDAEAGDAGAADAAAYASGRALR